jgi:hypothetical protein
MPASPGADSHSDSDPDSHSDPYTYAHTGANAHAKPVAYSFADNVLAPSGGSSPFRHRRGGTGATGGGESPGQC